MKIGILIYDSVHLLDVGGPYEVFLTASRLAARDGQAAPFEVVTLGLGTEPVSSYGGLRLVPQARLDEAADLDLLVLPGSIEINAVVTNADLLAAVRRAIERAPYSASVYAPGHSSWASSVCSLAVTGRRTGKTSMDSGPRRSRG